MPIVSDELDLDYIPGAAAADTTQVFANAGPRIFADDPLTFDSLWAKSASPKRGSIIPTLTYDPVLSRVRISAIGLSPAIIARIERSTDQIRWTTVRGGEAAPVVGDTVQLDDYEFTPNVVNYYRVSVALLAVSDTFTRTVTADWSNADTGQPWLDTGGLPADFLVSGGVGKHSVSTLNVTRRSAIDTGGVDEDITAFITVPSLITGASGAAYVILAARSVDTANQYEFDVRHPAGGATVDFKISRRLAGVQTTLAATFGSIAHVAGNQYGVRIQVVGALVRLKRWNNTAGSEPESWTASVVDSAPLTSGTWFRITDTVDNTVTNTLPLVLSFDNVTADTFAIEAGPSANFGIASITPTLTVVWLKSVARPFLNLTVRLLGNTFSVDRADRGGTFPIVGRSLPVAVTDVRGSRQYTLKARTDTDPEALGLELILASGDVLYLQAPAGSVVPEGGVFVQAGLVKVETPAPPGKLRFISLAVTEVAAPGPDVVGATSSWQTVVNTYATWADVIAAKATWADLLGLVASPTEVVVP